MNPEKFLGVPKSVAHSLIIFVLGFVLTLASDVFLQTISRPYWVDAEDSPSEGWRYHTISVVNPGPWSIREPFIEFLKPLKIDFVDWSPGVTWDDKVMPNVVRVSAHNGIPAGGMFFITYSYSVTNLERPPKVMCDGKECKSAPTLDADTMLKILLIVQGVLVISVISISALYFKTEKLLLAEKASAVNNALMLLASQMGEQDVSESARAVEEMQMPPTAKPKPVKQNNKNSKKPPESGER